MEILSSKISEMYTSPVKTLNVDYEAKPVKQKRRIFSTNKSLAIEEEVRHLLQIGHIREVLYPEWLANPVLVPKPDGKWRMCVDYTNLNMSCPKDSFPLPKIDQLVDATAGHEFLTFMDAFKGYNQIKMAPEDEEKTSFITEKGLYCYRVMPFGLNNVGATYQRMVNKVFKEQMGKNMEIYVDDMLVKSDAFEGHPKDLTEAFDIMRVHGIKLNPEKCAIGVRSGKILGFVVSQRGIEANPDKIKAILNLVAISSIK